jgi:peptide/nickel transport system substrate-binding protein
LRDRRVRAAIVAAIDRAALARPFAPLADARDGDRLPGTFAYDASIHEPRYDPRRAIALLEAAGWHLDGPFRRKGDATLHLVLVCYNKPSFRDPALIVQQQLAAVGIDLTIKPYDPGVLIAEAADGGILKKGAFDLALFGWEPNGIHDDSYLFRCDTRPPRGWNVGRICDPRIDREARIELTTADPAREAAADRRILRRLIAQSDVLFLGGAPYALAVRDGLSGVRGSIYGNPYGDGWNWHWTPRRAPPG